MSRAFVRESDGPDVPLRAEPELPPGTPNRVTPAGAAAFRTRVEALEAERAALGEGGIADARRAAIDDELRWLQRRIATFVETPCPAEPQRVGFGTEVRLEGDPGERTVRIVGVDEAEPKAGAISWLSPLARALIGAAPGDTVTVRTPGGDEDWTVLAIGRPRG